ncbi:CGNR zinc finger domain-containing protein [Streptomyces formicae]|uniref:ABATE domain-containing protein n=1 Tax=Streptomyces formicae TaxID=1616117 RepID=A0ABY3WX99_9ACTN|nr:ABATE domain-containing protein [Streptomyces formicae]UNM15432.1 ABATE domain-containing protein [Streptomyces formicae]
MAMGMGSYEWREWRFDAGRVCLDLVAAVPDRPELLARWLKGSGLLPPGTPLDAVTASWIPPFCELRDCVARLVHAELERRSDDGALARLNSLAADAAPPAPRAVRGDDGTLVRAPLDPPRRDELVAAVARDAVELLTDPVTRARLRRCEGDNCPRVYVDTSRGRRRRWCSSEVCGNRERVARHRRRAGTRRSG